MPLQVRTMAEEKEKHVAQIQELESNVTELLSKSGRTSRVGLHTAEYQQVNSVPTVQVFVCIQVGLMLSNHEES